MSAESINVGFIGAGRHAEQSHLDRVARTEGVNIRVLADLDETRLSRLARDYAPNAATTTDWHEVVEDPEVAIAFVMTPDNQHTEQLVACVHEDIHTFVEKPLANTWHDYKLLRNGLIAAGKKELVVSTCHPRRFDPPFVNTKELLDDRYALATMFGLDPDVNLGPVTDFGINLNYSPPSKTGLHTSFLSDHMPHEMDTASHFFGLSALKRAVSHVSEELEFDAEAERLDGLRLRFKGNRLQSEKGWKEDMEVTFADDSKLAVDAHTGVIALTHGGRQIERIPVDETGALRFKTDYERRFSELNDHFIRSVGSERETPYLTRREMLMNTVVALALQDVGRPVAISGEGAVARVG